MNVKEINPHSVNRLCLAELRVTWLAVVNTAMNTCPYYLRKFLD
jgi:hypothetical protein